MSRNRRGGQIVRPKMLIKCSCGQTLGHVDLPRYSRDGRPRDPLWQIGGLAISAHYNSNGGEKYDHDHYGRVHTHTFTCGYDSPAAWGSQVLSRHDYEDTEADDILGPVPMPNPARFTEAGVTERPRDRGRGAKRCGRVHQVRGARILARWHELAGTTEDTPAMEAMRAEKDAYLAAGKKWYMVLDD